MTTLDATQQTALSAMAEAHDAKEWARCAAVGDAWIEVRGELPALAAAWYGQSLMATYRLEEALVWTKKAVDGLQHADRIAYCSALSNYGQALARAGFFRAAKSVLKQMATLSGITDGEAREKQGHVLLSITDKWATGWAMTEGRLQSPGRGLLPNCRAWDGVTKEPVSVLHEQGIGDAILSARWLPWVAETTGHPVTWYGPSVLHRWIRALPGVQVGSIDAAQSSPDLGASCRAMSLPHLAGVRRSADVPKPVAPPELGDKHMWCRPSYGIQPVGVRVGVCWQGSAGGWHDFERSFPVEEFAPVFAPLSGVEFVNLTHQAAVSHGAPFPSALFSDVYETAELIASLDLVVSVDTAIVHLAGSLNVPTLAIVPTVPDWRYSWPGTGQTPFYPSVTVLRKAHMLDTQVLSAARGLIAQYRDALQHA
jgi:hypothetical protein